MMNIFYVVKWLYVHQSPGKTGRPNTTSCDSFGGQIGLFSYLLTLHFWAWNKQETYRILYFKTSFAIAALKWGKSLLFVR